MGLREYFDEGEPREKTVIVSPRIKGADGRPFGFYIRGISEKELREIRADTEKDYIFEVIKRGVLRPRIEPGCFENLLLAGEALKLFEEITSAGGASKGFTELKKQVEKMLLSGEALAVYGCLAAFEMGIKPKEFAFMDLREQACIGAFLDEKIKIKKRRGIIR